MEVLFQLYRNIGKYIKRDSFIHKSNALSKLILILCTVSSVFITNNYYYFIILLIILCCLAFLSKVQFTYYLNDIQGAWFLILLAFVFQLINGVNLHDLEKALINVLRILSIFFVVSIFMRSTKPAEISRCLERSFRFFKVNNKWARDLSITIVLVLRFFPIMADEINRIRVSQTLRGVNLSRGGIVKRLTGVMSIIVPVVVSTINRAEQLASAMETRRYGLFERASDYYDIKFKFADLLIIILSVSLICLALMS